VCHSAPFVSRSGLTTILVLSGSSTLEDVAAARVAPDAVLPDLAAVTLALR